VASNVALPTPSTPGVCAPLENRVIRAASANQPGCAIRRNKRSTRRVGSAVVHVASLHCISLIIKGLHPVRSGSLLGKHIQTAPLRHVMGFPHRGLLRELRQSMRHRRHATLASDIDLPRFIYLDSNMLRRLPIALFILACCKLTESSSPVCDGFCCPGTRPNCTVPSVGSAYMSNCLPFLYGLSDHVSRGDISTPRGG